LPPLDPDNLQLMLLGTTLPGLGHWPPLGMWGARTQDGTEIMLCDFASAGAHGTDYAAWLPAGT
jgi:hypothetical protein